MTVNAATRAIQKTIAKNRAIAGFFTIMDAGKATETPPGVNATRVPGWMLPEVHPETLKKMRPDIMIVQGMRPGQQGPGTDLKNFKWNIKNKYRIHIVEVGYCSDTWHAERQAEKHQQHQRLIKTLRDAGWNVPEANVHTLMLGTCGTILQSTLEHLEKLQVSRGAAKTLALRLHRHAVTTAHAIVIQRRRNEHHAPRKKPGGGAIG